MTTGDSSLHDNGRVMDCFKRVFNNDINSIPDTIMDNDEDRVIFILVRYTHLPISLLASVGNWSSRLLYVRTVLFACWDLMCR